jgi:hypothetical protein
MAIPYVPNTTCDIFHPPHVQGVDPPDEAGLPIYLIGSWEEGQENAVRANSSLMYTHKAHMDITADIRDPYKGQDFAVAATDLIFVPDQHGTKFRVAFVDRVNRELASNHKLVFLDRQTPIWPTNNV